ncbi:TonB-dependent receptor [Macellibacteroides fermentans]|uniref:TonB-dependent receptor n=1 Tax=Macellibacteroides fermentans TaxID=879969 RepID=UPI00406D13EA
MNKFIFLTICILSFGLQLHAEEVDTLNSRSIFLDEVVVQSFKQNKSYRMEPISASAFSSTGIVNRNITGIKEFSALVPNLFIPDYGSKLTSPVYIRGIGSKINAPSVGLYVDGIPYFEKSAFDFDFSEIDRIEVLRGPQGTLYGRNTMGGIINVFTKSPLEWQGSSLSLMAGNYGQRQASASHYGKLTHNLGYAISGNYNHTDGYFNNLATGENADTQDSGSGRIRLEWQLQPKLKIQLMTSLDHSDQGGYPYALYNKETNSVGQVNYNDFSSYRRTLSNTGTTVDYKTDRFWLSSQTAFQYLKDRQGVDQDFSTKNQYYVIQKQEQNMLSEELNIKAVTQTNYKWLFGAFGFYQGMDNEVDMDYKLQRMSTHKVYDSPTYGFALYHQSTIDKLFTDALSLTLGIRYDWEQAHTDYKAYRSINDTTGITDSFKSKLTFRQLTPKATLQYSFSGNQLLYATVSKGYKSGGFNTSFERDEDRSFEPEYSWNYEAGTKLNFWQNRIKTELSLFYIDWRNQQIYQPLPSGKGSMLKNAGRSESKGIEFALQANVCNGFMFNVAYGYTDATFKEYQRSTTLDYAGKKLPLVPSQTFSVGTDYLFRVKSPLLDRIQMNISYSGTGKLYWSESNEAFQKYYGIWNGKVSFMKGALTASIWGKNLTGTEYTAFYFESGGNSFAQKGKPVTFGGNLTLNF